MDRGGGRVVGNGVGSEIGSEVGSEVGKGIGGKIGREPGRGLRRRGGLSSWFGEGDAVGFVFGVLQVGKVG